MKKKPIVITLLIVGIALVCLSLILAVVATANKDIIGGADWPTFTYVFFYENRGMYSTLACCGVISVIVAAVVGVRKKKR
ncbi:MAG: hypothetical protein IJA58_02055 [Lachnospiraceae bacterium]|nr:hypothetical protein [Lachnospiraceae bacterium]